MTNFLLFSHLFLLKNKLPFPMKSDTILIVAIYYILLRREKMKKKKIASLILTAVAAVSVFTGCSNTALSSNSSSSTPSSSSSTPSVASSTPSSVASQAPSASAEPGYAVDGFAEGRMGDTMHNSFFDYTVNSAYVCSEYEGFTPQDGNEILVVDVTVKNTFPESIPMFDTDFQVQWNDDAEDAYGFPITAYEENDFTNEEMLPTEYTLAVNQTVNGLLVYEVPEGHNDFSVSYKEIYEDESEGDVFFVFFTADRK